MISFHVSPIYITLNRYMHCQSNTHTSSSAMLPPTPLHSPILSRRSLPYIPRTTTTTAAVKSTTSMGEKSMGNFDASTITVVAILVCAVVIGLVLNAIIRFAIHQLKEMWSAAGPSMGNPSSQSGVKRNALRAMPTLVYSSMLGLPGLTSECMICLSEFMPGEQLRVLPKCNHGFHAICIDQWLANHSSCPTCRQCSFGKSELGDTGNEGDELGHVQLVSWAVNLEGVENNCSNRS